MVQGPSAGHTIWLSAHGAAFVYLPKVACTSWKLFLARALHLPLPASLPLADVHNRTLVPLPYVDRLSSDKQQRFNQDLQSGRICLLAVIREPRERVLSAYLDKIWLHRNPLSHFSQVVLPEIRKALKLDDDARPSFLEFLNWVQGQQSSTCTNDHWHPQSALLGAAEALPSCRLWPMERMSEAVAHLQQLLGYSSPFPGREDLAPRTSSGSNEKLDVYFTPEVEALFQTIYAADIDLHKRLISRPSETKSCR